VSCQPYSNVQASTVPATARAQDASPMAAYLPNSLSTPALRHMLMTERDAHRRQRELVRASLVSCPGKPHARRRRDA
jgi:hypothetical protein